MTETTTLTEAAAVIAGPIFDLLAAHETAAPALRQYIEKNVEMMFRHLEDFAPRHVSVAAYAEAKRMGLPEADLRHFHWKNRHKLKAGEVKVFHWEHLVTTGDFRRALFDGSPKDRSQIETLLRTAEIAWILEREDKRLNELNYGSKRPDPRACYHEAGIELIEAGAPLP